MDILDFRSKAKLKNEKNLRDYIHRAKQIVTAGGYDFRWDDKIWKFPSTSIRFLKYEYNLTLHKTATPTEDQLLDKSFKDFSKAYIINSIEKKPRARPRPCFQALQLIDAAMRQLDPTTSICDISELHLEKAREIVAKGKSQNILGVALQTFSQAITRENLTSNDLTSWRHNFVYEDKTAAEKLPSDEAILAFAEIFSIGYSSRLDDESVYLTGVTALLLSAPMRISEQSWWPTSVLKNDLDSTGTKQYYLEYYSSKNELFTSKPFVPVMAGHAKTAIERLLTITEEGRNLAAYLESGSMKFYRHLKCPDVDDDAILTIPQLAAALGTSTKQAVELLHDMTGSYSTANWSLNRLWAEVRKLNFKRNPHFPYQVNPKNFKAKPIRMSESLMCFRANQLVPQYLTSPVILAPINLDYYNKRLTASKVTSKNVLVSSFFDRHNFHNLVLKSHQLRHFVNTAAQEGGYSIEALTEWSARASVRATRTYMHKDPDRIAREIGDSHIAVVEVEPVPITKDEYDLRDKGPVITTRYGICTHPWTVTPCQKSGDCLNCSELLHCKGHRQSIAAVQQERDQVAENLEAALAAIASGTRAATRWVDQHTKYLKRLDELLAMHSNPLIKDGSPVMTKGKDFTQESRILANKHPESQTPLEYNVLDDSLYSADLLSCLKLLRDQN